MTVKVKTKTRIKEKQPQVFPVLERIVENLSLKPEWNVISETIQFSENKVLFPYQVSAIENAIKALYMFFEDKKGNKQSFAQLYDNHDILSLELKEDLLDIADGRFSFVGNGKIPFDQICNRMSFWMATGSGKTLVIVKLIDVLFELMDSGLIPRKPVMFLTARDDLLNSFKRHVEEFNDYIKNREIKIIDLSSYSESARKSNTDRKVFIYRSDLLSDEDGNKTLNFEAFLIENEPRPTGDWYVILDEAHKGEKGDSKRQLIINILAQQGFLFNFSATFTDPIDIATTVYNINLSEFLNRGYGKQIYVSQTEIKGFEGDESIREFTEDERKKIILKALILLAGLKKAKDHIRDYYHNPLAVFLVNSVNQRDEGNDSDLKLLFDELLELSHQIDSCLFNIAKEELIKEFNSKEYTLGEGDLTFMKDIFNELSIHDIYKHVYNSSGQGSIEYARYPDNYQEIALKHTSSNKPFALIKLGTTEKIMKGFLREYSETILYEDKKWFENLNESESPFNLLIGSRAFYEGWDSSRPNVIVFINLGQQSTAKKFVLQSIGRGVRIEPIKNERMRSEFLANKIDDISTITNTAFAKALESLFVFGTRREAVEIILNEINSIKATTPCRDTDYQAKRNCLVTQKYKQERTIDKINSPHSFTMSQDNYNLLKMYVKLVPKERFLLERDCTPYEFNRLREIIDNADAINIDPNTHYRSFDRLLSSLISYIRNSHANTSP